MDKVIDTASFRDPSGFVFWRDRVIYRQINKSYKDNYDFLLGTGLYDELVDNHLLVPHQVKDKSLAVTNDAYLVIAPTIVPFISYPYEWCFSQLKDAALATLSIQRLALKKSLGLRDASGYNIQFLNGRPILIDTLSFERYRDGEPWVAYKQFCQHFLAPLALMCRVDVRLNQLMKNFIDGIPLDLASALLPATSKLNLSLGMHIHMHSWSQRKYKDEQVRKSEIRKLNKKSLFTIIDSLESAIEKLDWKPEGTEWHSYYEDGHNYSQQAFKQKENIVTEFIQEIKPETVWDLGANIGRFSRIASSAGAHVVAWDIDPACVETNYRIVREKQETDLLPLCLDLTNPSPGLGWGGLERSSFVERGPVDAILALGLVHHLAISNNVPLAKLAIFLSLLCTYLIIEFIPKNDTQVQKLLTTREDIFPDYDVEHFEHEFDKKFHVNKSAEITETGRKLYLMQKR